MNLIILYFFPGLTNAGNDLLVVKLISNQFSLSPKFFGLISCLPSDRIVRKRKQDASCCNQNDSSCRFIARLQPKDYQQHTDGRVNQIMHRACIALNLCDSYEQSRIICLTMSIF